MDGAAYIERRDKIRTYFDRTAVDAWKRLATEAPLGRIRASVREGRGRMRAAMLAMLPLDLSGWRVLDAGCGAGMFSVELARRGAEVTAIDLSPEMVAFAADTVPADLGTGRIHFLSGDMLSDKLGRFDAIVAMDSLIHYTLADAAEALVRLAARTERSIVFTFAPRTPALAAMHALGRLFPRGDRSPAIEPVRPEAIAARIDGMPGWQVGRTARIGHGFYTSQALEIVRS
ncbi:magnesium protoporphyrin IX methyltransferase [Aquibium carbonis]|uniref:Magnesium protoporphyrin IX methyltransferase n=1 Tax=Aquibium carbonis TaxID=2495581 RepID=A0A429YXS5_9HYPH|nr:magnesium protoporphyrin IX methyltransferase [Aquibium carbonis]RST86241.1 magnesium protoporphyrin IX methyltransferase [Aquibium carbonis]